MSCSASWLCKTIVYASVLFLKQLDTRNICVRMCVCVGAEEGKEPVKEDGLENLKSKIE